MVSVNEKYFIEKLACETAAKKSPQKFINNKVGFSSGSNLKYHTSIDSEENLKKFNNSDDSWGCDDNYEDNRTTVKSEHSLRSCDVSQTSRKRIAWGHQVIDNINNILSRSDLNSPSSSKQKRFDVGVNYFHNDINDRIEHYDKSGNYSNWDDSPTSQSSKRNSYQISGVNRKRLRYDDKEIFNKSKVKNYSIPPLSANWKYENVEYDEILIKVKQRTSEINDWLRIHKPKISLLGDSHARHLADIITEMLPGFQVEASVKPGAKSRRVLSGLKEVLKQMDKKDFIVTLSGTNDMWDENLGEAKSVIYNTVTEGNCTNLLLCNVPNNYLEPNNSPVQDNIINFNDFYQDVVKFSKWAHLVDLHRLKDRKYFTRHGLHFNLYGKIKICELVSNKILDIIDLIKTLK